MTSRLFGALVNLCLVAASLGAEVVTLKSKDGRLAEFNIQEVNRNGVLAKPVGRSNSFHLQWGELDLEWLKKNQPAIERRRLAALAEADPFSVEPVTTFAALKANLRSRLGREQDYGEPSPLPGMKPSTLARFRAAVTRDGKTSLLRIIDTAGNRSAPFSRETILWLRAGGRHAQDLDAALTAAIAQTEKLQADVGARQFAAAAKKVSQILAQMREKPNVESANWPDDFRALVSALR